MSYARSVKVKVSTVTLLYVITRIFAIITTTVITE